MNIDEVKVYGLDESIKASSLPMSVEKIEYSTVTEKDMTRISKLASAKSGSGHDCALKGIIVQMDLTAPQYFWMQWERYHFHDIISSQSKMHRITKMDIKNQCNEYVIPASIKIVEELKEQYLKDPTKQNYQILISNLPMGLNLTARVTTNYLQLKSIYFQRRGHKLLEWQYFCDEIEKLPNFKEWLM